MFDINLAVSKRSETFEKKKLLRNMHVIHFKQTSEKNTPWIDQKFVEYQFKRKYIVYAFSNIITMVCIKEERRGVYINSLHCVHVKGLLKRCSK